MAETPPTEGAGGARVVVHVGGSVAAYRAADVVTLLRRRGAEVRVVMTASAQRFASPLTLRALSGNPVVTSPWEEPGLGADGVGAAAGHGIAHLSLGAWAQVHVVVAASANLLARLAHGLADDAVTATLLATRAPVLVAPAMETAMWEHPATQANLATLLARGVRVIGPVAGRLASGHEGAGRLAEPAAVVDGILSVMADARAGGDLRGRHVVVTAGGTREPIDCVRFVSNHSSGKMGNAIAVAALARGARVTLVSAAPAPVQPGLTVVPVETAEEMLAAVRSALVSADVLVMTAAVADRRPATVIPGKLRKADLPDLLALVPTVDILAALRDDPLRRGRLMVGFAAETQDLLENARAKLTAKDLDLIVANRVGDPGVGMGADDNAVTVLSPAGVVAEIERAPKAEVARRLWDVLAPRLVGVAQA